MSEPIQVGDLVAVIVSCHPPAFGSFFVVGGFEHGSVSNCIFCGKEHLGPFARAEDHFGPERQFFTAPLSWLKRIPPLAELEGQRTEETIREPA